jgi:lysophospholipase L1-like esterase
MFKIVIFIFFSCFFLLRDTYSQTKIHYKWWDPAQSAFPVIEGQAWHKDLASPYDRLPARAKNKVRKPVWYLSEESAGLVIRFRSNASDIVVKYGVERKLDMPHMPSTGVSGVDLYALDKGGKWEWAGGKYHFGDTIEYHFSSLKPGERQYYLYLPLYNQVKWMEIGVPVAATMNPLSVRAGKPIVIYGTSITQGGVASRPGMAWPAILSRKLNLPVINLGFSGNGKLEKSITHLLTELDAKIYIIDGLGNMTGFPNDTIAARLVTTVQTLHAKRPYVPVIIAEDPHPGIKSLDVRVDSIYQNINNITDSVYRKLKASEIKNLYLLTADSIGLNSESTVEGLHPNDYGMLLYAHAYEKIIREILHKPRHSKGDTFMKK